MQIGDQIITREMMPSYSMTQANESHLEQAFQDVFTNTLGMQQPVQNAFERNSAGEADTLEDANRQFIN